MKKQRRIEIFSAGCPVCEDAIDRIRDTACPSCEVVVQDMRDAAAAKRAEELGIRELHLAAGPKAEVLREIQERLSIGVDQTASMGDDLPDLGLAARSVFFAAPANARPEVRAAADLITLAAGGAGAVRELVEAILGAQGRWPGIADALPG